MAITLRNRTVKSALIAAAGVAGLCLAGAPWSTAHAQMVFGMGAGAPPTDVGAPSPFAPPNPTPSPPTYPVPGGFAR